MSETNKKRVRFTLDNEELDIADAKARETLATMTNTLQTLTAQCNTLLTAITQAEVALNGLRNRVTRLDDLTIMPWDVNRTTTDLVTNWTMESGYTRQVSITNTMSEAFELRVSYNTDLTVTYPSTEYSETVTAEGEDGAGIYTFELDVDESVTLTSTGSIWGMQRLERISAAGNSASINLLNERVGNVIANLFYKSGDKDKCRYTARYLADMATSNGGELIGYGMIWQLIDYSKINGNWCATLTSVAYDGIHICEVDNYYNATFSVKGFTAS